MAGGFNYSEFRKLYENVQRASRSLDQWLESFLVSKATDALALTKTRTPVETGRLQREWKLSSVERTLTTLKIYIMNETEYASFMEMGFTYQVEGQNIWREGHHMAEISLLEVSKSIPDDLSKAFEHWLATVAFAV